MQCRHARRNRFRPSVWAALCKLTAREVKEGKGARAVALRSESHVNAILHLLICASASKATQLGASVLERCFSSPVPPPASRRALRACWYSIKRSLTRLAHMDRSRAAFAVFIRRTHGF